MIDANKRAYLLQAEKNNNSNVTSALEFFNRIDLQTGNGAASANSRMGPHIKPAFNVHKLHL